MTQFLMALSEEELLRLLPEAAGGGTREAPGEFLHQEEGRSCRVRWMALPPRMLGSLALEQIRVDVTFHGYEPDASQAYLDRFMAHFQRGGG